MDILIIAHFITEFEKDGTSRFVYIAEQLCQHHDVELVTSRFDHIKKRQRHHQTYPLNTKVTLLDEPSYQKNVCIKRFWSHASFGKQVKNYLQKRSKPDVIYCAIPSLECAYYAAKYARKFKIKFVVDVQDLWPEAFKLVFNVPLLSDVVFSPMASKARYVYKTADRIVGVSQTYCQIAQKANKKCAECIPVFLGTRLSRFDQYARENRVVREDNKLVMGYCGTLGHSYDLKCVLNAMVQLREKGYRSISFWVMGDGPLKNQFEEYARQNELDVVFYGRLPYDQMCGILASCDVCVNPISKGAAQSIINKHADYAASGLPVINTQENSEYRALVERYACGINCECSNVNQVEKAIARLYDDKEERIRMGARARKMAEDLFDREKSYVNIQRMFLK